MVEAISRVSINVDDLPELDTQVAIAGSTRHQEVGGVACIAIAAGVIIAIQ